MFPHATPCNPLQPGATPRNHSPKIKKRTQVPNFAPARPRGSPLSAQLHILRLAFPDPSLSLWGAETLRGNETFLVNLTKIVALVALVIWIFVCAASAVGALFSSLAPLRAYSADLAGSLLGVVAMTIAAALGSSPPTWMVLAVVPLLILSPRIVSLVCAAAVVLLAQLSVNQALFSPYNRLDIGNSTVIPGRPLALAANRDAHQLLLDRPRLAAAGPERTGRSPAFRLPKCVRHRRATPAS